MVFDKRRAELVIANDITPRKQAEETLRESETRFRMLAENLGEGIFITDLDDRILYMNSRMVELVGYTSEEMLGKPGYEFLLPQEEWPAFLQRNKDRESGVSERYELHVKRKDGTWIWLEVNAAPYRNAAGEIVGTLAANTDITERRRAEEVLRQSEKRYRLLFESNPHPMWVFDVETLRFLAVNRAAIQHYGYSREEFLASTIRDVHPPEDRSSLVESMPPASQSLVEISCRHQTKDQIIIDVEITAHRLNFDGRPARLVLAHDVTERKLLEGQIRQSQKMEAVGNLAGGIAHDFNNLLTAIIGYSELSLRQLDENGPLGHNIIEIKKAADRAASLTRQLLAFSRKQVLQPKVIDLNTVIADIDAMLQRIIGEDIHLANRPDKALKRVIADPGQITHIMLNLAVNARDAMPGGGRLIIETHNVTLDETYCREHPYAKPGKYARITVSDNGTGMDHETKAHVFEPFFTTKEVGKGTGLGLAMVYGIVKQHNGLIEIYSEVGEGTAFKIYFPNVEHTTEEECVPVQANARGGIETILVGEDEELLRRLAQEVLEGLGYTVMLASNGKEAVALYTEHHESIDAVMLDVMMPHMGGREAYEQIRLLSKDVPVIFMTGYSAEMAQSKFTEDIAASLILKPYNVEELGLMLREVLDAANGS
jgi:PAS domain S-box-containing protein